MNDQKLILVSNRGPITFERTDEGERTLRRGAGGLVTALTSVVKYRNALWIASTMTEEDAAVSAEHGDRAFRAEVDGLDYTVRLVSSDPDAYADFYSSIANPMLWFIQHYLWDLSNAPDIRREDMERWDFGYKQVNRDIADAVLEEVGEHDAQATIMLHDYHFYLCPQMIRAHRPTVFLTHFIHIPWTQPDAWRVLPQRIRNEIYDGLLANDIIGFHTASYCRNFLYCCEELMGLDVDHGRGAVNLPDGRQVWVRAYPLPIDCDGFLEVAGRDSVHEYELEVLRRRREHLILRVDRADLSKNVLRGFTAFDIFLDQHPEFRERVTFIAHLQPSRQDVPEYAEYLEKIEALVAIVNHRHGTTDWMPINLRLRENFEEAVATYKHYDLLMVNSVFDGMNLVCKEGPTVNERNGIVMLSENTGSQEELGEHTLLVNPFDVQQQADVIHRALTMPPHERVVMAGRLREAIATRAPGDWIDEQLADIELKQSTLA